MLLFCCMSAEFSSIYCLKTKVCSCVLPFPNYRFPGNCKLSSLPVVRLKCDQYKKQMNVPIYSCPFSRILKKKIKLEAILFFSWCNLVHPYLFCFPPEGTCFPLLLQLELESANRGSATNNTDLKNAQLSAKHIVHDGVPKA